MVRAWIIMQTEPGTAAEAARTVGQLSGVTAAEQVLGHYDVIARVTGHDLDEVGRLARAVQLVAGVTRTLTCWQDGK